MVLTENPIILHIVALLRQATEEDLRLIYQVVRAITRSVDS